MHIKRLIGPPVARGLPVLEDILTRTDFVSLTLHRLRDGWQANLQTEDGGGWRVAIGSTPSEALCAALTGFVPETPSVPAPPY